MSEEKNGIESTPSNQFKLVGEKFTKWYNQLKEVRTKATPGERWVDSHGSSLSVPEECKFLCGFNHGDRKPIRHEDTGNLSSWENDNDPHPDCDC